MAMTSYESGAARGWLLRGRTACRCALTGCRRLRICALCRGGRLARGDHGERHTADEWGVSLGTYGNGEHGAGAGASACRLAGAG